MSEGPTDRLNAALEGRYRIERQLGEGGMATVYLARDEKHNRNVALKVLKPELAAVVGAERFLAEIETTANLQHPHVLPLFDSGEADKFLFYVMPYVEGESLREKLDREHQLPVDEAVQIAKDVAEALDHAHRHGVIHRDIKPANILLQDRKPLISDFGIALAVTVGGAGRLTETGLSLGTPHYMSPEQATGELSVGAATDVYALGCVLYEMLVGEPPYTGSTPQAVLGKIVTGEADPVTRHRKSVPPNVDAAIRKALEKVPADRFAAASEFARALGNRGFRHGEAISADAVAGLATPGPWKRVSVATTSLASVFALAFAWSVLRPERPARVVRQVLSTEGWAGLDTEVGRYAALAPDGSSMILPLPEGQLGLKLAGSTDLTPIPGTEGARDVVYSPDGQWIAYAVGTDVFKRPLVGGAPIRLAEDAEGGTNRVAMAWVDDGTFLYERAGDFAISQISENGGDPIDVVPPVGALIWMHALPGGRGALLVNTDLTLVVVDLEDLATKPLLEEVVRAWYTPSGHLLYVRADGAVFAQPFDLDALEIHGGALPLFDGVRTTSVRADMRLAPDGTVLYVQGAGGGAAGPGVRLAVVDLEGNQEVLPLAPRPMNWASWSPDGEAVVFMSAGHVFTYDVVRSTTPRQITFDGANNVPVFSRDGTQVVFGSVRDGTDGFDLFVKALDDDAPPRSLATLEGAEYPSQWPNDTLIAFERGPSGGPPLDLWTLDLSDPDAPEARPYLTSEADLRPLVVSPDGTLAAYSSNETGGYEVYLRSFPNPGERTVVSGSETQGDVNRIWWSPDGNTLYYWVGSAGDRTILAARLRRDPVPVVLSTDTLFGVSAVGASLQALHPDGDRFIFMVFADASTSAEGEDGGPQRLILVENFFEELNRLAPN